jgi:hypothetical protein
MSSETVPEFEKLLAQILPDPRDRETFQRTLGRLLGQSPSAAAPAGPEAQPKAAQRIESRLAITAEWLRRLALEVELRYDRDLELLIIERRSSKYIIRTMEQDPCYPGENLFYPAGSIKSLLRVVEHHAPPLLPFPPRIVPSWRHR